MLIALAVAVHTKGLGFLLVAAMWQAIAVWRSSTERKTPRFRLCRVSFEKSLRRRLARSTTSA